jgi:hypothetical protein
MKGATDKNYTTFNFMRVGDTWLILVLIVEQQQKQIVSVLDECENFSLECFYYYYYKNYYII